MSKPNRLREWWQSPRVAGNRLEHRQVSFLELFYDLVYVAIIAQLSHHLAGHLDWEGLGGFAFLFFVVWWAWFNGTTYHDVHGNNDIRTRVFTFLQMFSVIAMGVFAHDAMGDGSVGFAISYAVFYLILTFLWWRTGVHDPNHRVLSFPYSIVFLVATLMFVGSIFFPPPWRFIIWGAAIFLTFVQLSVIMGMARRNQKYQKQIEESFTVSPSLVERVGLFSIIVLGEVLVGVVGGLSGAHHLIWDLAVIGVFGVLIGIGLWWLYFDLISHHLPIQKPSSITLWNLLHLPVTIGITTVGAVLLNTIHHEAQITNHGRWFLALALSMTLLGIIALSRTIQVPEAHKAAYSVARWSMLVSAGLVLIPAIFAWDSLWFLGFCAFLLLTPVFLALKVWISRRKEQ